MKEPLKVWLRNERQIEEAIINGEEVQVVKRVIFLKAIINSIGKAGENSIVKKNWL